jgi:hypothetical protein
MECSGHWGDTAWAMSEENVELVRRALQALDRRDLTSWLSVLDEDYEVVPTRDWPEPGVRGAEGAFKWYVQAFDTRPAVGSRVPGTTKPLLISGGGGIRTHEGPNGP